MLGTRAAGAVRPAIDCSHCSKSAFAKAITASSSSGRGRPALILRLIELDRVVVELDRGKRRHATRSSPRERRIARCSAGAGSTTRPPPPRGRAAGIPPKPVFAARLPGADFIAAGSVGAL
jgi:hypothetical protein